MTPHALLSLSLVSLAACHAATHATRQAQRDRRPPNVVLVFTDDQGYGDLSCYGHPTIHTPHIDALAAGGAKLTQFYVASPVCSPSRAALLTGCYPKRVGMQQHVIFPGYDYGLHTEEITLADLLRAEGYATGCFGKWHLGHRPGLLPLDQGFDVYLGVPYSNDMARFHRKPDTDYEFRLPLIEGREVIEWEPDQHLLTRRYTEAAVSFIEEHAAESFFVYLPHSMPHIPIYASPEIEGQSPRGLYGDVIEEIDWSVGQIQSTLERLGLLQDTLVIFTSDNGPWLSYKLKGGSAGLLAGGKGTNWEGGQRVPCIVSWPGTIPAGSVVREVVTAMDVPGATSPTEQFLYYTSQGDLAGIRRGPWKLLLGTRELYHVEHDVSEQWDLAQQNEELVVELTALAQELDAEITANARPTRTVAELAFDPRRPEPENQ